MRYLSKVRVVVRVRVRVRVQRHQPARACRADEAPGERGVDLLRLGLGFGSGFGFGLGFGFAR